MIDSDSVRQIMNEDDDIIAGPQKMSLRCPVCRSSISVSISNLTFLSLLSCVSLPRVGRRNAYIRNVLMLNHGLP